jgi:tetratricopeptide (TPR) repeat protein
MGRVLISLGLSLLICFAFESVRLNDFVAFDDEKYVTENAQVRAGLTRESVSWSLSTTHFNNWHPLTWLSHMLDVELYGLNAGGHHLTNLLIHILNSLLLFGLLKRMTGNLWPSAFVAGLFALHPLRVEVVAWVSERKELLSMFFALLSIWAYAGYARRGGIARYLLTASLFALGLMAKPMLVTLPLVLLLLDYWPLERMRLGARALLLEKLPLLTLSAASSVVTFIAQRGSMEPALMVPMELRAANAVVSYVRYMGQVIWPSHLSILYTHPNLPGGTPWSAWQVAGAGLLLLLISALVLRVHRKRYALVGWLWYLCTLLPVIGLVQVGEQAMADRYTYLPMIGLCIIVAWGARDLSARWASRRMLIRRLMFVSALAVLLACMAASWWQTRYWRDSAALFGRALQVNPTNPTVHYDLAVVLEAQGKREQAIRHWSEALRLKPGFAKAHNNLGVMLVREGRLDEAVSHYRQALRIDPDYVDAHYNLANVLGHREEFDGAIRHYREALRVEPDHAGARFNIGSALVSQGRFDEAIPHYQELLRKNPDHAKARRNLDILLKRRSALAGTR